MNHNKKSIISKMDQINNGSYQKWIILKIEHIKWSIWDNLWNDPFLIWFIFDMIQFWYWTFVVHFNDPSLICFFWYGVFEIWSIFQGIFLIFQMIWNFAWGISEFSLAIILWSFINLLLSSMFQINDSIIDFWL